jgi:hypothetical protein
VLASISRRINESAIAFGKESGMKKIILVLLWLTLTACATKGLLEENVALPPIEESIYIIGVEPEEYEIMVFPGSIDDGKFKQNIFKGANVSSAAHDGFVVGKAKSGEVLSIGIIRILKNKQFVFNSTYSPCDGKLAMTFRVPGGKVIYLGHVRYSYAGANIRVQYYQDIEAARKYVDRTYPGLRGAVESWSYELLPATIPCTTNITIPIYIPRR